MASTDHGPCKGRTLREWATGPLLAAVPIGLVVGFAYGVLRHFGIFN